MNVEANHAVNRPTASDIFERRRFRGNERQLAPERRAELFSLGDRRLRTTAEVSLPKLFLLEVSTHPSDRVDELANAVGHEVNVVGPDDAAGIVRISRLRERSDRRDVNTWIADVNTHFARA
ncbi:MAG: hypothetical protein M3Y87_03110 [Myxococcota bacterium]|nr:hypothetical protein [Myxococcota bacterium]